MQMKFFLLGMLATMATAAALIEERQGAGYSCPSGQAPCIDCIIPGSSPGSCAPGVCAISIHSFTNLQGAMANEGVAILAMC
jgi:hypothetical protein